MRVKFGVITRTISKAHLTLKSYLLLMSYYQYTITKVYLKTSFYRLLYWIGFYSTAEWAIVAKIIWWIYHKLPSINFLLVNKNEGFPKTHTADLHLWQRIKREFVVWTSNLLCFFDLPLWYWYFLWLVLF